MTTPNEDALARVQAGRNERYSVEPRAHDRVDPMEFVDILRRFVREVIDEALTARGIR